MTRSAEAFLKSVRGGQVYLVHNPELWGKNVYKIGMTNSPYMNRIKSYSKNIITLYSRFVCQPRKVEKILIDHFKSKFEPVPGMKEYFKGNLLDVLAEFDACLDKHRDDLYKYMTNDSLLYHTSSSSTNNTIIYQNYYE